MWSTVVVALAVATVAVLGDPIKNIFPKKYDPPHMQHQTDLMILYYYHGHEPVFTSEMEAIAKTWSLEKNIERYKNSTAVKLYVKLMKHHLLPHGVPFDVLEPAHLFEATTMFHVLYSAKDYDTFFKTAVYLKKNVTVGMYIYVLSLAITHRPDTQGIALPAIWEVLPHYFFNNEILATARRVNNPGPHTLEYYPSTYLWNDNVIIKLNETTWPFYNHDNAIAYFTHDYALNGFYYNKHLLYPYWLGGRHFQLSKDRRGEMFWYTHKQLLTRYYMERLSNGLGEIPEIGWEYPIKTGYSSGLVHTNGIPFPSRPNEFNIMQPKFVEKLDKIYLYEHRIREAIDFGYVTNSVGDHVSINYPEAMDILACAIEANADSPNKHYYKDFISIWKTVLGNSNTMHKHFHYMNQYPLSAPSALEHYQTALRDPAFYMIWKRVMNLFNLWQESLPLYKSEELALPYVTIQSVEVDKLVTYFEYHYVNVTNYLDESSFLAHNHSVLVEQPCLNHKPFKVRIHVKSDLPKTVMIKFFLAPKYDSQGYEIPLHVNTHNFFQLDQFVYDLPQGETVIKRDSSENVYLNDERKTAQDVFDKAMDAIRSKTQFTVDTSYNMDNFWQRLILPKGKVGGMPFVLMVYISEYHPAKVAYGTGFDPSVSLGVGSGARHLSDDPIGFPLNRPLYFWQIQDLHNVMLHDVTIYHKHTPEVHVPFTA